MEKKITFQSTVLRVVVTGENPRPRSRGDTPAQYHTGDLNRLLVSANSNGVVNNRVKVK